MRKIDLNTKEYTEKFAKAEIYAKKGVVRATQITQSGLENGEYADRGVRCQEQEYVIDTFVTRVINGVRIAKLEDTRVVVPGEWIVTNPKALATDYDNNYAVPDATFQKRYEVTDKPGIYRARGKARIIKNDTGEDVEIEAPWGGAQNGDKNCYFCAPYNTEHLEDLAEGDRYILSENDFATYGPLEEVLAQKL